MFRHHSVQPISSLVPSLSPNFSGGPGFKYISPRQENEYMEPLLELQKEVQEAKEKETTKRIDKERLRQLEKESKDQARELEITKLAAVAAMKTETIYTEGNDNKSNSQWGDQLLNSSYAFDGEGEGNVATGAEVAEWLAEAAHAANVRNEENLRIEAETARIAKDEREKAWAESERCCSRLVCLIYF